MTAGGTSRSSSPRTWSATSWGSSPLPGTSGATAIAPSVRPHSGREKMRAKATAKYLRIAPTKLARTIDLIRGRPLEEALSVLGFSLTRAARLLQKVLRSAAANAENNHAMNPGELWVTQAYAE